VRENERHDVLSWIFSHCLYGTDLEWKLDKPVGRSVRIPQIIEGIVCHAKRTVRAQSVLDAARPCAREGKLVHDAFKESVVDRFQYAERVGGKLNGTTKASKSGCFFIDCYVKTFFKHAERGSQASDSPTGYRDFERTTGACGETKQLGVIIVVCSISSSDDRSRRGGPSRRCVCESGPGITMDCRSRRKAHRCG